MCDIQDRAIEIRESYRFLMSELAKAGIHRDRLQYFLNISYPSLQAMNIISDETVYPADERKEKAARNVALYIHIPFCTSNCSYCHYFKAYKKSESVVDQYLSAVFAELEMVKKKLGEIKAHSVYIGGGTPSYLTHKQISRLFSKIRASALISDNAEISFEIHPEDGKKELFELLKALGVNRLNIGIESFNDDILKQSNRRHTTKEALATYEAALNAGFENLNIDLIYGLKGESLDNWERNLTKISELKPASACLYYLRLKIGTGDYSRYIRHPEEFPTEDQLLLMHIMTFEFMEQCGYKQEMVDWFIRDPKYFHIYQQHNWQKTDEVELLGLGASAYSYINGVQYYNFNDIDHYGKTLRAGKLPIWKGEKLESTDERMRRTLMLGLKSRLSRRDFVRVYGIDVVDAFREIIGQLCDLRLLDVQEDHIELSYLGKLFADEVGKQFYSPIMRERMIRLSPELISTTFRYLNPIEII